jgi:hypothetical protein
VRTPKRRYEVREDEASYIISVRWRQFKKAGHDASTSDNRVRKRYFPAPLSQSTNRDFKSEGSICFLVFREDDDFVVTRLGQFTSPIGNTLRALN